MPSDVLAIKLNKSPAVYAPGEVMTGEVLVNLNRTKSFRGIKLGVRGGAKVHWQKYESGNEEYAEVELYFNKEFYAVEGRGGTMELEAGEHSFPFTFELPVNIPNTFDHKYGRVGYNIKAIMEEQWAKDESTYLVFTVYSPIDLSRSRSGPIIDELHQTYCCILTPCISEGYMEAHIRIPRRIYEIGDRLEVLITPEITSKSVEILKIEMRLRQILEFHAEGKTKTLRDTVQSTIRKGPFRSNTRVKLGFRVPDVYPSGIQHCRVIDITYRLSVKFFVSEWHFDSEREYEIKIGSKSTRPPPDDSESFAPPTAPMELLSMGPSTSGTSSARPLPVPALTMDLPATIEPTPHPSSRDPPPIGFVIPGTSATAEPTSGTEPPPPSYETVMAQDGRTCIPQSQR